MDAGEKLEESEWQQILEVASAAIAQSQKQSQAG
jgi:hypothetical protein